MEFRYAREDVSVIMNNDRRTRDFGNDAPSGAIGTLGAIAAAVVGTGAVGLTVATAGAGRRQDAAYFERD